jgi:two-component system sensor histidine kinase UhpB
MRHRPLPTTPSSVASTARSDLRWVAVATMLTWLLSAAFELHEKLSRLTLRFETWQADELPLALTALAAGLAWYGWRRRNEQARLLAQNRELAQQLIAIQERERLVLARELHDEMAQHCTAIRVEASYLLRAKEADAMRAAAQRASDSAQHLLDSLRAILRRLRPADLDELGLVAALQSLAASCEARGALQCRVEVDGAVGGLGADVDMAVYRVVQEALGNVLRHAAARSARVRLERRDDTLAVEVDDDGCGFDPDAHTRGLGLLGAAERAAALGGRLAASSRPGAGTALRMSLPLGGAAGGHR